LLLNAIRILASVIEGFRCADTQAFSLRKTTMFRNGMRPVHPGEVLREDYLLPLGLSASALAEALHVPAQRLNEILRERRGITADTAMRLARYFGRILEGWGI
jgi:antitoxin HigA-1